MINVEEHLGLVHMQVKRCYESYKELQEYDDILQAGYLGLCKAANAFDETRGIKFSTYACRYISGEILNLVYRDTKHFTRTREGYMRIFSDSLNEIVSVESDTPTEKIEFLEDKGLLFEEMEIRNLIESAKLTEKQQKYISMHYYLGIKQCDIAEEVGIVPLSVNRVIKKGLEKMRMVI